MVWTLYDADGNVRTRGTYDRVRRSWEVEDGPADWMIRENRDRDRLPMRGVQA